MQSASKCARVVVCLLFLSSGFIGQSIATTYAPLPSSLQEQIQDSSLIVKGRLGRIIRQLPFYGYDVENKRDTTIDELVARTNSSLEEAQRFSIPLVEYEIIVDEVFYGEKESIVILRTMESDPYLNFEEKSSIDRIFFLQLNPDDKTYGTGRGGQLLDVSGAYYYELYNDQLMEMVYTMPAYLSKEDSIVTVFESLLSKAISGGNFLLNK